MDTCPAARDAGAARGIHEASLVIGGPTGALVGGTTGSLYGARAPYRPCVAVQAVFVAVQWAIQRAYTDGTCEVRAPAG